MPWVLLVPSYAAAAIDHGRSSLAGSGGEGMAKTLEQVEAFSLDSLLTTLAQGDAIDATARKAVYEKLAGYIGLPLDVVERYHGRVPRWVFAKRVLGGQRLIGLYDASITAPDPDPDRPMVEGFDPTIDGITAPVTSAFNAYVRDELGFETDLRYQLLNQEISRDWDWQSGDEQKQGYRGAADHLKAAIRNLAKQDITKKKTTNVNCSCGHVFCRCIAPFAATWRASASTLPVWLAAAGSCHHCSRWKSARYVDWHR